MQRKIQGIENAGDTGFWEEIKMGLLIISQRLPLKFKAPQTVVQQTTQATSLQQLEAKCELVHSENESAACQNPTSPKQTKDLQTCGSRKLNARQALHFFHEHLLHHLPQIKRLAKKHK